MPPNDIVRLRGVIEYWRAVRLNPNSRCDVNQTLPNLIRKILLCTPSVNRDVNVKHQIVFWPQVSESCVAVLPASTPREHEGQPVRVPRSVNYIPCGILDCDGPKDVFVSIEVGVAVVVFWMPRYLSSRNINTHSDG